MRRRAFAERLARWQEKALREAKLLTDWALPNQAYESRRGRHVARWWRTTRSRRC